MKNENNAGDKIKTPRYTFGDAYVFEKVFRSFKETEYFITRKFLSIPTKYRCEHGVGGMFHDVSFEQQTHEKWSVLW